MELKQINLYAGNKIHFKYRDIDILKRMEKDLPCNTMKAGMAILVSGKVDFRTEYHQRQRGHSTTESLLET